MEPQAETTESITPEMIGHAFVTQFYSILHKTPEVVHRFYQDSSTMTRPARDGSLTTVRTIKEIDDLMLSLDCNECKTEILTADAQASHNGGVIVLVTGCLTGKDNVRRKFTEMFFLAPQSNGYYVLNDAFRFVGEDELQAGTSVEVKGSDENVLAPTTPVKEPGMSGDIPMEVLFEEILVRLPVKFLTLYKSVCKTWLYTIESSSFQEAHRRRHIRDYSDQILFSPFNPVTKLSSFVTGLVTMTPRPLIDMLPPEMTRLQWPHIKLDEPRLPAGVRIKYSVIGPIRTTGIYCIASHLLWGPHWLPRHCLPNAKISICNPATRSYKLANPFSPEEMARLLHLTARQLCDVRYGFGVASDGDYKVVVVVTWTPRLSAFLSYVYSFKQRTWKKIVDSESGMVSRLDLRGEALFPEPESCFGCELCPQAFVNGCWHWTAMFSSEARCHFLSFDMDNEVFKLVLGPPNYRGSSLNFSVVPPTKTTATASVLNDRLAALYHTRTETLSGAISVWMMMEYGDEESWVRLYTVNLVCDTITTLVGISYSLREDEDEDGSGVRIRRIWFQECYRQLVSCDESGVVERQPGFNTSSGVFWNTLGVSAYSETFQRL